MKYTRCERLLLVKPLCFFGVVFSSLEYYVGFGATNVRVKTGHSISLSHRMTEEN